MSRTPKDQVKEKLEHIKDEQNRKFSLLYEHYKINVEAVYQQQNLKLNSNQQLEQDQLNEDLENQMSLLYQSHSLRRQQQVDTFFRETEHLEAEKCQNFRDFEQKIQNELQEFDNNSKQRLNKLKDNQREQVEKFDKECYEKYSILINQSNRHSMYNLGAATSNNNSSNNSRNSSSPHVLHYSNQNPQLSFFGGTSADSELMSQTSNNSNNNNNNNNNVRLSRSSTSKMNSVVGSQINQHSTSSSSMSSPSHFIRTQIKRLVSNRLSKFNNLLRRNIRMIIYSHNMVVSLSNIIFNNLFLLLYSLLYPMHNTQTQNIKHFMNISLRI